MAKDQKSLRVILRQNKNEDSKAYGKWYAELMDRETLSTRGLAKHISSHGSPFTEDTIIGVLAALSRCIPELISEGTGVKLDGLGQFYPSLESTGAEQLSNFSIQENVKGVHIRFLPDSSKLDNMTSREFRDKCSLTIWGTVSTTGSTKTGNLKKTYHPYMEDDASNGAGGGTQNP